MGALTRLVLAGLFSATLSAAGWAQEPVLRLIDMRAEAARPVVLHQKAVDKHWYPGFIGTRGAISDHFKTDAATVAALEFFLGGRVGIARDTDLEIITDRSVSSIQPSIRRVILRKGLLWMKSKHKLKQPLEIQTNGGIMGIKGTEFTLEELPDQATHLAVIQGQVEIKDRQQELLGLAKAGDVYDLKAGSKPVHRQVDITQLKADIARQLQGAHLDTIAPSMEEQLQNVQSGITEVKEGMRLSQGALQSLQDKLSELQTKDDDSYYLAPPYRDAIQAGVGPGGGQALAPTTPAPSANETLFTWKEYPGADGYVIFVSDQDDFKNIIYSDRIRDTRAVYPSLARPLTPGKYFWRIIPVDADDSVVVGALAGQASFTINP